MIDPTAFIHAKALIDAGAAIGARPRIWGERRASRRGLQWLGAGLHRDPIIGCALIQYPGIRTAGADLIFGQQHGLMPISSGTEQCGTRLKASRRLRYRHDTVGR